MKIFERHDDLMGEDGWWTVNLWVIRIDKYRWGGLAVDLRRQWKRGPALVFIRWRGRWPRLRPNLPGGWTICFPWFAVWRRERQAGR